MLNPMVNFKQCRHIHSLGSRLAIEKTWSKLSSSHLQAELAGLLLQLPRMMALSHLELSLGFSPGLACLATIPKRLSLVVSFQIMDVSPVELEWLLQRSRVSLQIVIGTVRPGQHQAVVRMLQQLPSIRDPTVSPAWDTAILFARRVELAVPFTQPLQRLWGQCTSTINLLIQTNSPVLQVLPRAALVVLTIIGVQEIAWSAMLGRSVVIRLGPAGQLHVHGCPHSVADSCDGPTELCIMGRGSNQVLGFPATLFRDCFGEIYHIHTQAVPLLED